MQRSDVMARVRLFLKTNDSDQAVGIGLGVVKLCQGVDRLGSLNRAAQDMGMAYSKAWRIVKKNRRSTGVEIIYSPRGKWVIPYQRGKGAGENILPGGRRAFTKGSRGAGSCV